MKKVLMLVADGFEEIEAVTLIDVLRRADISITVTALKGDKIQGAHGITILADQKIDEVKSLDFDMVLIPGGMKNTLSLCESPLVKKILIEMDNQKKIIGAICAAPLVLHKANLLKGSYTCYPGIEEDIGGNLKRSENRVVVFENVMTSQGPATAMEFGLIIVRKLLGEKKYHDVKDALLVN